MNICFFVFLKFVKVKEEIEKVNEKNDRIAELSIFRKKKRIENWDGKIGFWLLISISEATIVKTAL